MAYTLIKASVVYADDSTLANKRHETSVALRSTDQDLDFSKTYSVAPGDEAVSVSFSIPVVKALKVESTYPVVLNVDGYAVELTEMTPPRQHVDSVDPVSVYMATQTLSTLTIEPIEDAQKTATVRVFIVGAES